MRVIGVLLIGDDFLTIHTSNPRSPVRSRISHMRVVVKKWQLIHLQLPKKIERKKQKQNKTPLESRKEK